MSGYKETQKTFITQSTGRIRVEIGDIKQPDTFLPRIKLKAWDNECNVSFGLSTQEAGTVEQGSDGKIIWKASGIEAHFYSKPIDALNEDGAYEFEVVLLSQPKSNIIPLSMNVPKDLDFFYQGELTEEEKKMGATRPENVIGSYAVYHSSKAHNKYKTGKAFHIYRPDAVDAKGNRVWCDLHIDPEKQIATITLPQKFLETAVYPVTVDPTFGYTSIGASQYTLYNSNPRMVFATLPNAGTISSISAYAERIASGAWEFGCAIYDGSDFSRLAVDSGNTSPSTTAAQWVTTPISLEATPADYLLGFWFYTDGDNGVNVAFDSIEATAGYSSWSYTWENWPLTFSGDSHTRRHSVYATYEESATETIDLTLSQVGASIHLAWEVT